MKGFSYIPGTADDRARMLATIGVNDMADLFADIPEDVRLTRPFALPEAASEWTLMQELKGLARQNVNVEEAISFLGAGAYQHYIPSVVDAMISRSEFYTAYTPYQPEISQGVLQAIFEYQTIAARLFGLDVSNASLYDGPTALGEAAMMACSHTRRSRVVVCATTHPDYKAVLTTYAKGQNVQITEAPLDPALGITDWDALKGAVNDEVAAIVIQYPNFLGQVEDVAALAAIAHERGALLIVSTYPIALGVLQSPGALSADIVVAEGQSLGNTLSFGGPYLGMMAVTQALTRRLPGRIAGQTKDVDGRRAFVLTLQAREQHIRREKASSNICSNQALNALAASVYVATMGPQGLADVAQQCLSKAYYTAAAFTRAGFSVRYPKGYFNEFVLSLGTDADRILSELVKRNVFLGYRLDAVHADFAGDVLVAVTEVRSKQEIDEVAQILGGLR